MNNKKLFITSILIFSIFIYSALGSESELVENLNIPIAIGNDLNSPLSYSTPISSYIFDDKGDILSETFVGTSKSIGETRQDRQIKSNKKFLLGIERLFLMGQDFSELGIRNLLNILVTNPTINEKPNMVVCSGKAEDMLNIKLKGYSSSGEFIDGLIKNAYQFNFFSKKYTIMDVIKQVDTEGYNIVLPYIEQKDNNIEITGLAIFNKDKMVYKTNLEEARIINLLRENDVKAILTVQETTEKYVNYYAKSKRKVHCYKDGDKYKFIIDIKLNGVIASNTLYKDLNKDFKTLNKFYSDMEKQVTNTCNNYILEAKSKYAVDVLNLGAIAAAKYGRDTGVDWNKVFADADIEVRVKVKVINQGKGTY